MSPALTQIAVTFLVLVGLGGLWYGVQRLVGRDIANPTFGCGGCHADGCEIAPDPAPPKQARG